MTAPHHRVARGERQRGEAKTARIPIKIDHSVSPLRKPDWIRAKAPTGPQVTRLKRILRQKRLHTVCEEASCPNLGECFGNGTATFLIMGDICTRRCPFCDVAHGRPNPLDPAEPENLAATIQAMGLRYVVITSVDRDDLRDGGAAHFVACIEAVRRRNPQIHIEALVPDFRGRMEVALQIMGKAPPDVFNHNLESIPRLYKKVRPGADYRWSLTLLKCFKDRHALVPTKSGLMLGLGERIEEVEQVMADLRDHGCEMLTLGQYLQPSAHHLTVRSSYHAESQARELT
jgi:lipoic acid synthetase